MSASTSGTAPGSERAALSPAVFHILFALADGEMHGYGIMRSVEQSTDGEVRLGPGTLYGAVKKLLADGLIRETDSRPDPEMNDERRRYYALTGAGARALNAELARFRQLLNASRGKKLLKQSGGLA